MFTPNMLPEQERIVVKLNMILNTAVPATTNYVAVSKMEVIFFIALFILIPFPNTPLNRSPVSFNRGIALRRLWSFIFKPFFTSSQSKGIDTGAKVLDEQNKARPG